MDSTPKISVVIPTYNRPHTLPRAIYSVLRQSFKDLEVIVVDDASATQAASEIVAQIAMHDPRVRCIRREKGGSASAARNTGIEAARGEYIAFQDDDDEWLLGKLERQFALMMELGPECVLVGGRLLRHTLNANPQIFEWPTQADSVWIDTKSFIDHRVAFLQTALIRKSALDAVGSFNPDVAISEDFELTIRLLKCGRFATVKDMVTLSYVQQENLSDKRDLRIVSNKKILELHGEQLKSYPIVMATLHYEIAKNSIIYNQRRSAFYHWWQALRFNPRVLRVYGLMPMLIVGGAATMALTQLSTRMKQRLGRSS